MNTTALIFNLKNRFPADWRDCQEIAQTGGPQKTYERMLAELVDLTSMNIAMPVLIEE